MADDDGDDYGVLLLGSYAHAAHPADVALLVDSYAPAAHAAHLADAARDHAERDAMWAEAARLEEEAGTGAPARRAPRRRPDHVLDDGTDLSFRAFSAAVRSVQWADLGDGSLFRPAPAGDDPREKQWVVMTPRLHRHWATVGRAFALNGQFVPAALQVAAAATQGLPSSMLPLVDRGARGRRSLMHLGSGVVADLYVEDVFIPGRLDTANVGITTIRRP